MRLDIADHAAGRPTRHAADVVDDHRRGAKLALRVAAAIVKEITDRGLAPGDMLPPEADMVRETGVGRATVREGLRVLEAQGVISMKPGPHGGPVVRAVGPSDVANVARLYLSLASTSYRDVLTGIRAIEPTVARVAAANIGAGTAPVRGGSDASLSAEMSAAGGVGVLGVIVAALRDVIEARIPLDDLYDADLERSRAAVVEAVNRGQAAAAERRLHDHLLAVEDFIDRRTPAALDEPLRWTGS